MRYDNWGEMTVNEFTNRLSSKEPVPGGGSVAALTGALGAALGGMVADLTVGKPKYADVEEEVKNIKEAVGILQRDLLMLIEKDANAFAPLARAYRMASGTESEKLEKERVMQECLVQAALVPLEIMEKCAIALPLIERLAEKGSVFAVSDAGCAVALLKASTQAAWLNVRINVRMIKDEVFAAETDARGKDLLNNNIALADRIYGVVETKLL